MIPLHTKNALRIRSDSIPRLALILRRMGFADPLFQDWRIGQRFGVARPLTSILEWHIRGFGDGSIDSEVEISRKRLQHVASRPGSYYLPLMAILRKNNIPFLLGSRIPPDATHVYLPEFFGRAVPIRVPSSSSQPFGAPYP